MIIGTLSCGPARLPGHPWDVVFDALKQLTDKSPEGCSWLGRDGMSIRVMSYPTKSAESDSAILESHRRMVDVQMTIEGSERIDWFPLDGLEPKTAYDAEKDVQEYWRPGPSPAAVDVHPGTFVILFPEDAHMPQLTTAAGHEKVTKAVVKIPLSLVGVR